MLIFPNFLQDQLQKQYLAMSRLSEVARKVSVVVLPTLFSSHSFALRHILITLLYADGL